MSFISNLHLHSRYSRATSREMKVESLARWARRMGIALLGTGDFTHPTYFAELQAKLTPGQPGLYRLKKEGQAMLRVREGLVMIVPGYDGVYGTIKVLGDELSWTPSPWQPEQMHLL